MELKWRWDKTGTELELHNRFGRLGYIEAFEKEYHYKTEHTKRVVYNVQISSHLSIETMDCEKQEYVTLRKAMRALKETVTVLIIGRSYGT